MSGNRKTKRKQKMPAEVRHKMDLTTSIYRPPADPPSRERGGRWRRVLQSDFTFDDVNAHQVLLSQFFHDDYNTTGFSCLYLHRVSVWSGLTLEVDKAIAATLLDLKGGDHSAPTYSDSPGVANSRAKVGFYVPNHLSGPRLKGATFLEVRGSKVYRVEVDATFV